MAIDPRIAKTPRCSTITEETELRNFDSAILIDAGGDGFRLEDENGGVCVIPTGIPISIGGPSGYGAGYMKVIAPVSGSLNVSVIKY